MADADARAVALTYLPYCAAVPLIGLACWQLDGFFLGATQGKALRNAGVVAAILYVGTDMFLKDAFANTGVWIAFLTMYVWRAGALGVYLPSMIAKVSESQPRQPAQQT